MLKEVRNAIASQVHTNPEIRNRAFVQSPTFPTKRVIVKSFVEATDAEENAATVQQEEAA